MGLIPPPGGLTNPGIERTSSVSPTLVVRLFTTSPTWEALIAHNKLSTSYITGHYGTHYVSLDKHSHLSETQFLHV